MQRAAIDREKFGARLKDCFDKSGLTRAEIAREIGVSPSMIHKYITGKSLPSLITFYKLKILLKFRADYLLGRSDEP